MTKVLVHIGLPKTGSTTIQGLLHNNQQKLVQFGVLYPSATGAPTSKGLVPYAIGESYFGRYPLPPDSPRDQYGYRQYLGVKLLDEIAKTAPQTVLISSEALGVRLHHTDELERLAELFSTFATSTTIIAYLRRQDEAALSFAWNYVRSGASNALAFPPTGKALRMYDYYKTISLWAKVFGKSAIRVQRFGQKYFSGGDLLSDFLSIVGVDKNELQLPRAMNSSPGAKDLQVLDKLNPFISGWSKTERTSLSYALSNLAPSEKHGLSRDKREAFLSRFEASNRQIAKEFLEIEGPLFDHVIPDDPPPQLSLDDVMIRVAALAERLRPHLVSPRNRGSA